MNGSGFQAFVPVIPVYIIFLFFLISLGISWWSYSYLTKVSRVKKNSLILLRGVSFTVLLILLLNPLFINESTWTEKPAVLVYLDDSQSVSINRGDYDGLNDYRKLTGEFQFFQNSEDFNFLVYKFDSSVQRTENVDISARGSRTNLNSIFRHQIEEFPEAVAALVFSDGIVTHGAEPVFTAQDSQIPFYFVPVGDTTTAKDIAVSEPDVSGEVFINTKIVVNAVIQQNGFENSEKEIQLLENNEVIQSERIRFEENQSSHEVGFELNFEEPGIRDYKIRVPFSESELTEENNVSFFTLDVKDNQTIVWYMAYEIHPDVGAVSNLIERDQSYTVHKFTWDGSNSYMEGEPDLSVKPDAIVIHGLPDNETEIEKINEWTGAHSSLFITTPQSYFEPGQNNTGFLTVSQPQSFLRIIPETGERESHPIFDIETNLTTTLPPLRTMFADYRLSPVQQILGYSRYQGERIDIPYLVIEETGNRRSLILNAFDWYRYFQNRDDNIKAYTENLFTNIFSWISATPGDSRLQINTISSSFNDTEDVKFRATLYNESDLPENNGLIGVEITGEETELIDKSFTMKNSGDGTYTLNAGSLPPGSYHFEAEAMIGDRTIDNQDGSFSISNSTREFLDTKRNDQRLRQLAEVTGGKFLAESPYQSFMNDLNDKNLIRPVEKELTEFLYLYQFYIWFFVIIATLSAEWMLRRSVSLP